MSAALCPIEGCGRSLYKNYPLCRAHHRRLVIYGDPLATPRPTWWMTTEQRFWHYVQKTDGCWLWTGHLSDGYAIFSVDGRPTKAHRWAYEHFIGPIPFGHQIDHVRAHGCLNRHCVNPAHLEAVTQRENIRRGNAVQLYAKPSACVKGHPFDDINTYQHPVTGTRACRTCSRNAARRRRMREATA